MEPSNGNGSGVASTAAVAVAAAVEEETVGGASESGSESAWVDAADAVKVSVPGIAVPEKSARLLPNAINPAVIEHYRRLRTKLIQEHATHPFRTVVVTSASPDEGKTLTTLNLAFTFAMLPSFKVLVIDGDLRRGTVAKWLGMDAEAPGLANLIEGSATAAEVLQRSDAMSLSVVTRGSAKTSPGDLLNSRGLKSCLSELAKGFDLVLLDSPPMMAVADAHLLARAADGVLVVARAFATTQRDVEKMMRELQGFRILGAVFNGATATRMGRRYAGYYY